MSLDVCRNGELRRPGWGDPGGVGRYTVARMGSEGVSSLLASSTGFDERRGGFAGPSDGLSHIVFSRVNAVSVVETASVESGSKILTRRSTLPRNGFKVADFSSGTASNAGTWFSGTVDSGAPLDGGDWALDGGTVR